MQMMIPEIVHNNMSVLHVSASDLILGVYKSPLVWYPLTFQGYGVNVTSLQFH